MRVFVFGCNYQQLYGVMRAFLNSLFNLYPNREAPHTVVVGKSKGDCRIRLLHE